MNTIVMCREIGQGFGLNTKYYNETAVPNLYAGSCLDLLDNPNPTKPNPIVDFDSLQNLYGKIEIQERRLGKSVLGDADSNNTNNDDDGDESNTNLSPSMKQLTALGRGRGLGRMLMQTKHYEIYENLFDGDGEGSGGSSGDRLVTIVYLHQEEIRSISYFKSFMGWLTHSLH